MSMFQQVFVIICNSYKLFFVTCLYQDIIIVTTNYVITTNFVPTSVYRRNIQKQYGQQAIFSHQQQIRKLNFVTYTTSKYKFYIYYNKS